MRWRGWGLVLAVLAALGGLAVAGRLLDVPRRPSAAEGGPAPDHDRPRSASRVALSPAMSRQGLPAGLLLAAFRPSGRPDGPARPREAVGPSWAGALAGRSPLARLVAGPSPLLVTGRCTAVLFRAASDGRLDRSAVAYWDAPAPLGGPAIVRGTPAGEARRPDRLPGRPGGVAAGPRARPGGGLSGRAGAAGGGRPACAPARAATASRSTAPPGFSQVAGGRVRLLAQRRAVGGLRYSWHHDLG